MLSADDSPAVIEHAQTRTRTYPYPYPHPYPHPYPYPHPHPSPGKLGISLEKNVVAKVGDPDTQAAAKGVQPGWVLVSIAGAQVEEDKAAGEPPRR